MKLSDYIERKSDMRPSLHNPLLKNIAIRCGVSIHMIQSLALGRRFASRELAEKIEEVTSHIVSAKSLIKPKEEAK